MTSLGSLDVVVIIIILILVVKLLNNKIIKNMTDEEKEELKRSRERLHKQSEKLAGWGLILMGLGIGFLFNQIIGVLLVILGVIILK